MSSQLPGRWQPQGNTPLLPQGLLLVYLVAPLGLAVVMADDVANVSARVFWRQVLANYVPFLTLGATFHLVYARAMPRLLSRLPGVPLRLLAHLAVVVGVSAALSLVIGPIHGAVLGKPTMPLSYAIICVVVSATCVFPGLLVQRLRLRAQAAERAYQAERQAALQAQLEALRARTDPHFLFNSLNTVAALIPEDPKLAERALEQLADLFRYALDSSRVEAVTLGRELEMIADYLALQSARFGGRLRSRMEVEEGLSDVMVPPLLLQPLVENAIVHGAARRGGAEVLIRAREQAGALVLEVLDDGPGPGASTQRGAGSAVAGIAERVRLHYAGRATFRLAPRAEGGCVARLCLPLAAPAGLSERA